ncbi:MAG: zinc carboxypeptidase [Elusimicrobiota bacterium]
MKIKNFMIAVLFVSFSIGVYSQTIEESRSNLTLENLIKDLKQRISSVVSPQPNSKLEESLKNDPRYFMKVMAKDKYQRTKLLELGFDIIEVNNDITSGFINKDLIMNIQEKDFTIVEKKTIYDWVKSENKDFPSADSAYHNYNETTEILKEIYSKNQDITSLFSIGKSYEGREIWCLRINPTEKGNTQSKKPGVLLVGNHHSREHLTNEMVLLFAVYILENRNDSTFKKYIENLDIYIIPMLNPDGVEYDIATGSYRWWRKNTNKLGGSSVVGVDLNRNYDFEWCKSGASSYQYSDTYCGKSAFSEPESKNLKDFMTSHKNIKTAISYHSYSSLVLYPWGGRDNPVEDEKDRNAFIKHAKAMASLLGYEYQQSSDLYIASGDMADWAYDKLKVLAWTIELEGNSFYPGSAIIDKAFEKNKKACLYLLSITENPYQ